MQEKEYSSFLADTDWWVWIDPEDCTVFGLNLILNIKIIYNRLFFDHLGPRASTGDPRKKIKKMINEKRQTYVDVGQI